MPPNSHSNNSNNNNNNRNVPKNRIWTVNDLHEGTGPGLASSVGGSTSGARPPPPPPPPAAAAAAAAAGRGGGMLSCCHHIPNLPNSHHAQSLLQRVVREFEPIVQQRGYSIASVSELCCCGDGLDHRATSERKRRRKKVADNIWGYNQTTFGHGRKSHTIHLRLRHPSDHSKLLLYEDVAGTMAHELSHCEYGPHNDKFFKLMDDILEQHATLMASGLTKNGGYSMPSFSGIGHALGTSGGGRHRGNANKPNNAQQMLREARLQRLGQQPQGGRLGQGGGGGGGGGGYTLGGDKEFVHWMTPREAAVVAAEARRRMQQLRLRGDHCCRPVTINLDDDSDNEEEEEEDDYDDERGEKDEVKLVNGNSSSGGGGGGDDDDEKKIEAVVGAVQKRPLDNRSNDESLSRDVLPQVKKAAQRDKRCVIPSSISCEKGTGDTTGRASKSVPSIAPVVVATNHDARSEIIDLTGNDDDENECVAALEVEEFWNCRRCTYRNYFKSSRPTDAVCDMCESPQRTTIDDDASTKSRRLRIYK